VKYAIAIGSGKGGVGKSTVAVNLAVALAEAGAQVGLLDGDMYGPSIPMMMGAVGYQPVAVGNRIRPFQGHFGVRCMSLGFLLPQDQAVVWRGPMIAGALQQFLREVEWGELDYLLVDLPPGTGDVQLTLAQSLPLTGAVIVMTPQDVAMTIAKKTLAMFRQLKVPITGIVENMSYFVCPHCHQPTEIFSRGGGRRAAEQLGTAFLGEVPLDLALRVSGDEGKPTLLVAPESEVSQRFREIARALAGAVEAQARAEAGVPLVTWTKT
jgi:ATP-binding protein involved in chromosome partitioning